MEIHQGIEAIPIIRTRPSYESVGFDGEMKWYVRVGFIMPSAPSVIQIALLSGKTLINADVAANEFINTVLGKFKEQQ